MKKIIIFILFILSLTSVAYAQYGDYYDGRNSYTYGSKSKKKKTSLNSDAKHYIGISPSLYIPTGSNAYIKEFTGIGGGVELKYKYNFFSIFGLESRLRYNYANGHNLFENADSMNNISTEHHLIDMQVLAILQYEDIKATKGFIPYVGVGMDISISIVNSVAENFKKESGTDIPFLVSKITEFGSPYANIGVIAVAGLRYAFSNNITLGGGIDYTYVYTNHDYSGLRVFVDLGYRF